MLYKRDKFIVFFNSSLRLEIRCWVFETIFPISVVFESWILNSWLYSSTLESALVKVLEVRSIILFSKSVRFRAPTVSNVGNSQSSFLNAWLDEIMCKRFFTLITVWVSLILKKALLHMLFCPIWEDAVIIFVWKFMMPVWFSPRNVNWTGALQDNLLFFFSQLRYNWFTNFKTNVVSEYITFNVIGSHPEFYGKVLVPHLREHMTYWSHVITLFTQQHAFASVKFHHFAHI